MASDSSSELEKKTRETRLDAAHAVRKLGINSAHTEQGSGGGMVHAVKPHEGAASQTGATQRQPDLALVESDEIGEDIFGQLLEGTAPEALARQAVDLACRLKTQLTDIDRRQAQANAQEAEFESRIRNARLWFDQRESELDEREEELIQRDAEIRQQAAPSEHALDEANIAERAQQLELLEAKTTKLQTELEFAQAQLQEKLNDLEIQSALAQSKQNELDAARQAFEQRHRELDEREAAGYRQLEQNTLEKIAIQERTEKITATSQEITHRQEELCEWETRLGERASETEFQRADLERQQQTFALQQSEYEEQLRQLKFRGQEIKTAIQRYERLGITEQKMIELQRQANEFDMRDAYLSRAESLLAEQQVQFADRERQLEQQELAFENQVTRARRVSQEEQTQAAHLFEQRDSKLNQREAELEQRQAALEQLQEELRATQREVLEMRLATEETWLQLQGALAPATLSRSISQVRTRLADHFQLATEELQTRRHELENVRLELTGQHSEFQLRRAELESWFVRRERDIEQRAARLVAREKELDAQQRQYDLDARRWQIERGDFQREIQKLLAESRQAVKSAA
jgi:hypothetical protein